jgi:dienelactone hydrolase
MRLQEHNSKKKNHKKLWITLALVVVVILMAVNFWIAYVSDYYEANTAAQDALLDYGGVTVTYTDENAILFIPEEVRAGFIFYPGGKVEYTAYAPLLHELAENGIFCVLPHMPCNLAVLDVDAADGYIEQFPQVEHWYIGGHSLGGSMAASYYSKHRESFDGLVLCAAYSTADLTGEDGGSTGAAGAQTADVSGDVPDASAGAARVLSIYSSNDGVLSMKKYEKYRKNLPDGYEEEVIDGGCHAFFGSYGAQEGDGEPSITNAEQIHTTVDFIVNFLK